MFNIYDYFANVLFQLGINNGEPISSIIAELTCDFLALFFGLLPLIVCFIIMRKLIIWGD